MRRSKERRIADGLMLDSAGLTVGAEFIPMLKMYVTMDYQETQLVKGEIESLTPIWQENMLALGPNTTLLLKRLETGQYIVTSDSITPKVQGEMPYQSGGVPLFKDIDIGLLEGKVRLTMHSSLR